RMTRSGCVCSATVTAVLPSLAVWIVAPVSDRPTWIAVTISGSSSTTRMDLPVRSVATDFSSARLCLPPALRENQHTRRERRTHAATVLLLPTRDNDFGFLPRRQKTTLFAGVSPMAESRRNLMVGAFVLFGLVSLGTLVLLIGRGPSWLFAGKTY